MSANPDREHVSTPYVKRHNLSIRMGMRRFRRLTNTFGKEAENLAAAVILHFVYYNFAWPHKSLANPYSRTPRWLLEWPITFGPWMRTRPCRIQTDSLSTDHSSLGGRPPAPETIVWPDFSLKEYAPPTFTHEPALALS